MRPGHDPGHCVRHRYMCRCLYQSPGSVRRLRRLLYPVPAPECALGHHYFLFLLCSVPCTQTAIVLGSWIPSLKCQPSPRQTLCPQSASHQISTCPSRVAFWSRRPVLRPSNSRSRSPRFADQWTEECFSWPFKVLKPSPQLYDWSTFRIATGPHLSDLSAPRCRVTVGSTFSFLWAPTSPPPAASR